MKRFCNNLLIVLVVSINGLQAQTMQTRLNQVELMKQFVGNWKCELGKDTFLITENTSFGTGMMSNSKIVTSGGAILDSIIQLYGYDKIMDKFIVAELIKSSPVIEICNAWFTSAGAGEIVITNPDNAPIKFKFEFKTPDLIVQTALINGKVFKEIKGMRIKSDIK